jgi:hypothetical protein
MDGQDEAVKNQQEWHSGSGVGWRSNLCVAFQLNFCSQKKFITALPKNKTTEKKE